jgi:hypothetical protein
MMRLMDFIETETDELIWAYVGGAVLLLFVAPHIIVEHPFLFFILAIPMMLVGPFLIFAIDLLFTSIELLGDIFGRLKKLYQRRSLHRQHI